MRLPFSRRGWVTMCGLCLSGILAQRAEAQVVLDGSLGPAGPVSGPIYVIGPELGQLRGTNLFHSFSQINIAQGETLGFVGPSQGTVNNVLARVTGGSASNIDGSIISIVPGANLFLINPNGIIFGPNAAVTVDGAFVATTANFIRMADGGRFDASLAGETVLTSAPPSAFGFLGAGSVGTISINGSFIAGKEQSTLSFVGGDVSIVNGALQIGAGRINLVAAKAGELALDATDVAAVMDAAGLTERGTVSMENSSASAISNGTTSGGSGQVTVIARDLTVRGGFGISASAADVTDSRGINVDLTGTLLVTGATAISTTTSGAARGGDLNVKADVVRIENTDVPDLSSFISTFTFGSGRAGDVIVRAKSVSVEAMRPEGAVLSSSAADVGTGGNLDIEADTVSLTGFGATFRTTASGTGVGGDIRVRARDIRLLNGGQMSAFAINTGFGGAIDVAATESILVDGFEVTQDGGVLASTINTQTISSSVGAKGVTITSPILRLSNSGNVGTETLDVDAPPIQIDAGLFEIDGGSLSAATAGAGRGGMIDIYADVLSITNGGTLESSSLGSGAGGVISIDAGQRVHVASNGGISTLAAGPGALGGSVNIVTRDLEIFDGSIITTGTIEAGNGGPLTVSATRIRFSGPQSGIASPTIVTTPGAISGNGSVVTLTATESITIENGARVSTSAGTPESATVDPTTGTTAITGVAGDIFLESPLIRVTGSADTFPSRITSTTNIKTPGTGGGGNVTIRAGKFELLDNAVVAADTTGSGPGGSVSIFADNVTIDRATASSSSTFEGDPTLGLTAGAGGSVSIDATQSVNLRNGGRVSVQSVASNAGNISIDAIDQIRVTDSTVITSAGGTGGDINLGSRDPVSRHIDPAFILFDTARINANAVVGNAGNIFIISQEYVTSSDTLVTATSEQSAPGRVDVSAAYTELAGGLVRLPGSFTNAAARLQELCGMQMEGDTSSFITTGRGGAPISPEGLAPSFDLDR